LLDESMLRCAVIGFGWWGQTITARLLDSQIVRVTRVVDAHAPALQAASKLSLATSTKLEEALQDSSVDAVIVATPNARHEEQVVASARAGKHVFCEKPLGLTLASAKRSVKACHDNQVVLGIGHERRFEPAIEALRNLVTAGKLGTILHAEAAFSHDKIANLPKGNWRKDNVENPAGGMTGCGVHLTDFLIWMLGPIELVSAVLSRTVPEWDPAITCQFGFANGVTGSISAILATPLYIHFRIFGTSAWAEVVNEAHPDSPDGRARLTVQRSGQAPETMWFSWTDTVKSNLEEFAGAVEGRDNYRFTSEQILHNVEVLEAVTIAARSHQTIRLPTQEKSIWLS
jgi:predicted dehydrogenase